MGNSFADVIKDFDEVRLPREVAKRFHLIELLASNDCGETYLLSDKSEGKQYVLKAFRRSELHSEVELLQDIEHKGLPRFEQHIISDGTLFTLREYINGISLEELLRKKRMLILTRLSGLY